MGKEREDRKGSERESVKNYTYILHCSDGTFYTGWTTDLDRRVRTHNEGHGAKYTRSRIPVRLVYYETFSSKTEAMQREYAIKRLSRSEKLALIRTMQPDDLRSDRHT